MRRALAALALAAAFAGSGCAGWSGARLYAAGNDALERGDFVRAIDAFERAADLVPHASEIQNHLGIAHLRGGHPEQARAAFRRAVALDCDNHAAHANLLALERELQ